MTRNAKRRSITLTMDFTLALIAGAICLTLAGVIYGLYLLTGFAEGNLLRWITVVAVMAIPVSVVATYRIATIGAREHLLGFDRGLDEAEHTIHAIGRGLSATAAMARASKTRAAPTQDFDDLLPRPGAMKILKPPSNDRRIIEM